MFGKTGFCMAPGQGFHLRGLENAPRTLGEIREVQDGTSSVIPPSRRRG